MGIARYLYKGNSLPSISANLLKACMTKMLDGHYTTNDSLSKIEIFLTKKNNGNPIVLNATEKDELIDLFAWVDASNDSRQEQLSRIDMVWSMLVLGDEVDTIDSESDIITQIQDISFNSIYWT